IYRKWNIWDEYQPAFFASAARVIPSRADGEGSRAAQANRGSLAPLGMTLAYIPALLKASVITIVLSCLAMVLAVAFGVLIASGRVYASKPVRAVLTLYVEVVRGTPVLLQLFVLYYGLHSLVSLPAISSAIS